jgi:hypothetical protein
VKEPPGLGVLALGVLAVVENIFHLGIENNYHLCYIMYRLSLSSPKYNTQPKSGRTAHAAAFWCSGATGEYCLLLKKVIK